jgi:hypothetical protein
MATKKKMLQAAAGNAGGGAGLDVESVFSTYLYKGTGSGQTIQNGINLGQQAKSAEFTDRNAGYPVHLSSTISLSGDFTIEGWIYNDSPTASGRTVFGSDWGASGGANNYQFAVNASGYLVTYSNGTFVTATSQPISTQQWYHVAASRSGSTIYLWVDGQAAGSATDSNTFLFQTIGALGGYTSDASWVGRMSNFRVSNTARYTSSFTPATEALTSDSNTILLALQDPPFVDQTNTYSVSNDSTVSPSTISPFGDAADDGEGGLVWIKSRTESTYGGHALFDTERGATNPNNVLSTSGDSGVSATAAQYTSSPSTSDLTSFNANGFSLGPDNYFTKNTNGEDYASWTFRKAPKFFTCVTYTGDGVAGRTVSHNLGSEVGCLIVKRTDTTGEWMVWHKDVADINASYALQLQSTNAAAGYSTSFNSTAPTSTEFTLGNNSKTNNASGTYVAYLFAHNDGDGEFGPDGDADIIKCGSFTAGSSGVTQQIDLGWEPQWVLVKNVDDVYYAEWRIYDVMRGMSETASENLKANASDAAEVDNPLVTAYSQGFKGDFSAGGLATNDNYIYIAIRRGTKVPESATEVFDVQTKTASRSFVTTNFVTDLYLQKRPSAILDWYSIDRMTGGSKYLSPNTTAAQVNITDPYYQSDLGHNNGYDNKLFGGGGSASCFWSWKRAPGFFDAVAFDFLGGDYPFVDHNLGVVPELIIMKSRDETGDWCVMPNVGSYNHLYRLFLNESDAIQGPSANYWANTAPTATQFRVDRSFAGGNSGLTSSTTMIAYLFASLPGISKVGSYTGTGSAQTIDCGFTTGARFVLIKETSGTSPWHVFDTERGIVAGNDPRLKLDNTDAQTTTQDFIDPAPSGFAVTSSSITNGSGDEYIFYAIA